MRETLEKMRDTAHDAIRPGVPVFRQVVEAVTAPLTLVEYALNRVEDAATKFGRFAANAVFDKLENLVTPRVEPLPQAPARTESDPTE